MSIGAFALAVMGTAILWPASNLRDRVTAIPAGSSRENVYSQLGRPLAIIPIHSPDHEKCREVWIYAGPVKKVAPKISFSPLRVSFFDRSRGPRIDFDYAGRVESVTLPEGRAN